MSTRLHNSLVEVMVVVGMDQDTGLRLVAPPQGCGVKVLEDESNPLFCNPYEPQVVAAISAQVAMYPHSFPKQDTEYPPVEMMPIKRPLLENSQTTENKVPAKFKRRMATKHMSSGKNIMRRISVKVNPVELPITAEVINSLTTFCFPDNAYVYKTPPPDHIHYLVLTDMTGIRTFATCHTFYRPFIVQKEKEEGCWQILDPDEVTEESECKEQFRCWVPTCCVLISKYAYLSVMKDCLSCMVSKIKQDPEEMRGFLKEFALQLTMTPVPPPGKVAVSFSLYQLHITLTPPEVPEYPITDIPLNTAFLCFPVDTVLDIITCLLTQQRVVFISAQYALLTIIIESFLTFILPFTWRFTYVPVLSNQLLELIEAPGTFLMGCSSQHKEEIEKVPGLVIADIDSGTLHICESISVPKMPEGPAMIFRDLYNTCAIHHDLHALDSPSPMTYEEMRESQAKFQEKFKRNILIIFIELMVNLFRDIIPNIKPEKRFFNKQNFLDSLFDADKPFYEEVLQTDMFSWFLRQRFNLKRDYWAALEEKTRPVARNSLGSLGEKDDMIRPSRQLRRQSTNFALAMQKPLELTGYSLPEFECNGHQHFYEVCIDHLSQILESCKLSSQRASYLYLRGMLRVAAHKKLEGLEDFHNIAANDTRIVPTEAIGIIMANMTTKENSLLQNQRFYKKSELFRRISLKHPGGGADQAIIMDVDRVLNQDVELAKFSELCQFLEMASDPDAIQRLFHALTLGRKPVVDPATFTIFYECWKDIEIQCNSVRIPEDKLDPNECVLKVSSMIKTDRGNGWMVLTPKRILFIEGEGSHQFHEIIRLRDIQALEKIQQFSFVSSNCALRIFSKVEGKKPFVASLKDDRNTWYMVIMEMWSGKLIAEELMDPGIIQQTAQNVLLVDALIRSGEDEETAHHSVVELAASHLCYFRRRKEDGVDKLPPETKDVLQHRISPNAREVEKRAIETLLYTPGNRSSSHVEESGPRLWCGMGSGKIKVYDASTWMLQSRYVQAKDRVVCLLSVGDNVWAGSFDTNIYVIDTRSLTSHQKLMEHTDMVSAMTTNQLQSKVFSASLNGQVIVWNVDTLQVDHQIQLDQIHALSDIKWIKEELWCCTKDAIVVVSEAGEVLRTLNYRDEKENCIQLDCFHVTNDNQVWTGCRSRGEVVVWDALSLDMIERIRVDCRGISKMVQVQDKIWVGSKNGVIHIFNSGTRHLEKQLKAHTDSIRSMCAALNRYVMSGAGSNDGKVAIWRTSAAAF